MKVLFITRGFPSENDPMAGNYEAVQAKAIAAKGCSVSVLTIQKKPFYSLRNWNKVNYRMVDGVNVYEGVYPSFPIRSMGRIVKCLKKKAYMRGFERIKKDQGLPDIVHAHIVSTAFMTSFIIDEYHIPFVITEHWTKMNVSVITERLEKMANVYHKADKVICVSQALANSLRQNFKIECTIINNMVSDLFFQYSRKERDDNTFNFIACGAFRKNGNKGFDILVDAFAKCNFPQNVILNIIGDGEDRPFIERKISQNGCSNQIHLLGVKTPEEVSELLCGSDCFVLSSRLETFSIVVIEAMAKGLPVIATRCGGPETFLLPEHGILVEKENTEELADAMNYMLGHFSEYDSQKIRKYCYDHFSQDVIAGKIIEVYNQLLNQH